MGSVQPENVPTATDVVRLPVAEPLIVPLRVMVTVPPEAKLKPVQYPLDELYDPAAGV